MEEIEEQYEETKENSESNNYNEGNEIKKPLKLDNSEEITEINSEMTVETSNGTLDTTKCEIDEVPENETPNTSKTQTSGEMENKNEIIDRTNDDTLNNTRNDSNDDSQRSEFHTKSPITNNDDIFDQFIDQYRGERRKYLRGIYFYGCFKNTYHFISHLPIQRIFFPYFENIFDSALYFVGINGESEERNSIKELDMLLSNYIDYLDKKVDSSKDNSIDQIKYLKEKIIENPTFQSKIAPIIQSSYQTISEISTKIPFLKH